MHRRFIPNHTGEATQYELPSPRAASVVAASESTAAASETSALGLSARMDMRL